MDILKRDHQDCDDICILEIGKKNGNANNTEEKYGNLNHNSNR